MARLAWLGRIAPALTVAAAAWLLAPDAQRVAGAALDVSRVEGKVFPKRIIDPVGQLQLLPAPPRRIASAILAGDEMLAELVDAGRVVSVTYLVDDAGISNAADRYPSSIFRNHADAEELLSTAPDLVIVATYTEATDVRLLTTAGLPLLRFIDVQNFADIETNLRTLAAALGEETRGERLIADMRRRLAAVAATVAGRPRPRTLFYSLSGSSSGAETLNDATLHAAGGFNVLRETRLSGPVRLSQEFAIGLQPEVILLSGWSGHRGDEAKRTLLDNPAWRDVPAVRNGRIYLLDGAAATTVTPFRVQGVEAIARLLHPEVFAHGEG